MQQPQPANCGNTPIDLTPVGVNVMIAVDDSKAMSAHWEVMQGAIKQMLEQNRSLNFGAHLFWADVSSLEMVLDKLSTHGRAAQLLPRARLEAE